MVTLHTIEPLDDKHGMLIVEAFSRLFINGGGQPDGFGEGWGYGTGDGDGCSYDYGDDGYGDGYGGKFPEEWSAPP